MNESVDLDGRALCQGYIAGRLKTPSKNKVANWSMKVQFDIKAVHLSDDGSRAEIEMVDGQKFTAPVESNEVRYR